MAHTSHTRNTIEDFILLTPSVIEVQDKLEKAAEKSILQGALSTQWLYDLSLATERHKPRADGNKIVQKYGEIYGSQARRQIAEERAEELKVVNIREVKLARPWRAKYKKVMAELLKLN